jgi:hypothetical protein
MFVLSLCKQLCPDKLPVEIGPRLGDGADGEVLSIVDEPDKVIKLGIFYERHDKGMIAGYQQIKTVLDWIMVAHPDAYARVYQHGYLGTFSRKMEAWRTGQQDFIIYYYIMEKLQKISEDESRVFHTILSHEDRGMKKNYSTEKIQEMLGGLSKGLDFDVEKITLFCRNIKETQLVQNDLHVRNIMKNDIGCYKIIDIDRCEIKL